MSKEESVRKLAEAKAYLEKRMTELQEEASKIESILEAVDTALAEKSFKKVELPSVIQEPTSLQPAHLRETTLRQIMPLRTPEGIHLADMSQTESELTITPTPGMRFDVTSPPFRAFLVGRVLEPMRNRDTASAKSGELALDKILSYNIEQDGNLIKTLTVRNYGDERRIQELKNAIRWTLRRMYERSATSTGEQHSE